MLFEQASVVSSEWVGRPARYPVRIDEYVSVRALNLAIFGDEAPLLYSQHVTTDLRNSNLLSFSNVRVPNLYVEIEAPKCWLDRFESIRGLPPLRLESTHPYLWLTGLDAWLYLGVPAPTPANLFPQCSNFYKEGSIYFCPTPMLKHPVHVSGSLGPILETNLAPTQQHAPSQVHPSKWSAAKLSLLSDLLQAVSEVKADQRASHSASKSTFFLFLQNPDVTPKQNAYLDYYHRLQIQEQLKKPTRVGNKLTKVICIEVSKASSVYLDRQQAELPQTTQALSLSTLEDLQNKRAYFAKRLCAYLSIVDNTVDPLPIKKPFPLKDTPQQFATKHQPNPSAYAARLEMWLRLQDRYQSRYGYASGIFNPGQKGLQRLSVSLDYFGVFGCARVPSRSWFWAGPNSNALKHVPLFPWALGKACLLEYIFTVDRSQPTAGFWKLATASELRLHTPCRYLHASSTFWKTPIDGLTDGGVPSPSSVLHEYLRKRNFDKPTYLGKNCNNAQSPVSASFETWLLKRWIHQQWCIWSIRDWLVEDTSFINQPKDPLVGISWLKVRGFSLRFASFIGLPLQHIFYNPLKVLRYIVFCKRLNPRVAEFYKSGWVIHELPLEEDLD